jgi:hypothetical protein
MIEPCKFQHEIYKAFLFVRDAHKGIGYYAALHTAVAPEERNNN